LPLVSHDSNRLQPPAVLPLVNSEKAISYSLIEDPLVVRPGEGHYHLAVDVDCVVGGEIIPPGTPSYIHFGSGADRITMQFEPGEHRLCLQVADGEHRVIGGPDHASLTKEIHITVAEQ